MRQIGEELRDFTAWKFLKRLHILGMKHWLASLASIAVLGLISCSFLKKEGPPLQGSVRGDDPVAAQLFAEAQAEEAAGETHKAYMAYKKLANSYPADKRAAKSKYQQAILLKTKGRATDAFNVFQEFIERYPSDALYDSAIMQQEEIAHAAAHGTIRTNFFGLKSRLDRSVIIAMLLKVRDNAPRADSAPRAQFTMGQVNEFSKLSGPAISAYETLIDEYPRSTIAPDAQFRIGEILLKQANEGNQDQANLARAKNSYRDLLLAYPDSPFADQARQRIATIGSRDLQSSYDIGEFYRKKGEHDSAAYYYQDVINRTTAGELRNKAAARLSALTN